MATQLELQKSMDSDQTIKRCALKIRADVKQSNTEQDCPLKPDIV